LNGFVLHFAVCIVLVKSRREEQTGVFENGVRRGIFGPEEKEVTDWKKSFPGKRRNCTYHDIVFGWSHQGE
jgi:hypothetical protein